MPSQAAINDFVEEAGSDSTVASDEISIRGERIDELEDKLATLTDAFEKMDALGETLAELEAATGGETPATTEEWADYPADLQAELAASRINTVVGRLQDDSGHGYTSDGFDRFGFE